MSHKSHPPPDPTPDNTDWYQHTFGNDDEGKKYDDTGVKYDNSKIVFSRAAVTGDNFNSISFTDGADMVNGVESVAPDHDKKWTELSSRAITSANNLKSTLAALDGEGGWQGAAHDASVKSANQSHELLKPLIEIMEYHGAQAAHFHWAMNSANEQITRWTDQYHRDINDFPHWADVINEKYAEHARTVMGTIYRKAVDTIRDKNPDLAALQQPTAPNSTSTPPKPDIPSPAFTPPKFDEPSPTGAAGGSGAGGANSGVAAKNQAPDFTPPKFDEPNDSGTAGGSGAGDVNGGAAAKIQSPAFTPPNFAATGAGAPGVAGGGGKSGSSVAPPSFTPPDFGTEPDTSIPGSLLGSTGTGQPGGAGSAGGGSAPSFAPPDLSALGLGSAGAGSTGAGSGQKVAKELADSLKNDPQFAADFTRALDDSGGDVSKALDDPTVRSHLNAALNDPSFADDASKALGGDSAPPAPDMKPAMSALGTASQSAGQLGQGMPGGPGHLPSLPASALHPDAGGGADPTHSGGAGGSGRGGGGLGGRSGLTSPQPLGAPVAATRSPSELTSFGAPPGGMGAGAGMPPGGGAPPGGQRGGEAGGKAHTSNKSLRSKRNGKDVIGEPDAVVSVIGDDAPSGEETRGAAR
jgi:hypothetical protein